MFTSLGFHTKLGFLCTGSIDEVKRTSLGFSSGKKTSKETIINDTLHLTVDVIDSRSKLHIL